MPALKTFAAVVVNRNTVGLLGECLDSIRRQDFTRGISVWVVDNASSDDSAAMALSDYPEVNLLWNSRNTGYARACNRAAGLTREPYLMIMNADTVLSEDADSRIADFFGRCPRAGAVGPRLVNTDGTLQYSCREFPSVLDAFLHAFVGLLRTENRFTAKYRKTGWDHLTECEVDWVSGAFMAVRREAFEEVGGFDDGYYMYVEDVDLCWRMKEAGWTVGYIPAGDVTHHVGQSSRLASTRMTFHHHLSMLRFNIKTYRGPARGPVNALVGLGVGARFALIAALNLYFRLRARLGGRARLIMPGRQ